MVWKQATDCCTGTAVIYGAPDLVKVSQLFSDTDVSDTVTIHESVIWTFQSNCATAASFRISNPAQDFNYVIDSAAIIAQRVITLPLLIGDDTWVTEAHIQTLTNKTIVAACNTITMASTDLSDTANIMLINAAQTICGVKDFLPSALHIRESTGCFDYIIASSDLAADRIITLPVLLAGDVPVYECHIATLTGKTFVAPVLGTPASGVLTNMTGLPVTGLANGTDGELITWSCLGVAETVAVGCCGQVLTSNGACNAPTFQAAGAADNLGNHTATTCLIMGTNAITFGVDVAAPAACVSYVTFVAAGVLYNAISCDIHNFTINAVSMLTIAPCIINTPCGVFQEGGLDISPVGTHTQWIPAGAWGTRTTNGATFNELELVTNDIQLQTFDFVTGTEQGIQFWWEPPAEWNVGAITFNAKWTETGGAACGTVVWCLAGHSYTDSDAIDAAIGGTPNTSTDTNHNVDNDMQISPESCDVVINGATKGEAVLLELTRVVACDTLSVDAKLIGINITYTTDEATAT